MLLAYNGWPILASPRLATVAAPGCTDTGDVLAGDVHTVLQYLVHRLDAEVEPAETINGYRTPAQNAAAGGDPRSTHQAGCAIDYNGARHPWERRTGTAKWKSGFTPAQVAQVRRILADLDGLIRWGIDYAAGYRDPMHFDVYATPAQLAALAARITTPPPAPTPTEDPMTALTDDEQRRLLAWADQGKARLEQVYNASLTILARTATAPDVDEAALAAALAPMLTGPLVDAITAAGVPDTDRLADQVVANLGAAIVRGQGA